MIIYQVTNNNCKDKDITEKRDFLFFSQYYATKEEATKCKGSSGASVYQINLMNLGREEVAEILSMGHVSFEHSSLAGGFHEIHDISTLVKNTKEVK